MIGPFPFATAPNRCHLSVRERRIWDAFVQQNPGFFTKVWYDVEVGGMRGTTQGLKPEWEKNAQYLGRYKIDVVGENTDFLAVVEVKGEATTKALGELWLYDDLLKEEWTISKPVRCICLTDEEMPNIRTTLEKEGYELVVVTLPLNDVVDSKNNDATQQEIPPVGENPVGK